MASAATRPEHTHGPFAGPYSGCPACEPTTEKEIRNMEAALHDLRGRIVYYRDMLERAYKRERQLVNEIADAREMP